MWGAADLVLTAPHNRRAQRWLQQDVDCANFPTPPTYEGGVLPVGKSCSTSERLISRNESGSLTASRPCFCADWSTRIVESSISLRERLFLGVECWILQFGSSRGSAERPQHQTEMSGTPRWPLSEQSGIA